MLRRQLKRLICLNRRQFGVTKGSSQPYIEEEHLTKSGGPNLGIPTHPFKGYDGPEQYWDNAAQWYDRFISRFSKKIYETMTPFLHLEEADKILEVGAGTGVGAEVLLENTSEHSKLYLTDYSNGLLEYCKAKNLPRTEIKKVNPDNLPFPGEYFDRYLSLATIEELLNPELVLTEAFRVLKPTGILGMSVLGKHSSSTVTKAFGKVRSRLNIKRPLQLRSELTNPGILKAILKECGFQKTITFYEQCHYPSTEIQELKKFFLEEPTIKEAAAANSAEVEQIVEAELTQILKVEETPLNYEALIIIAYK